MKKLTCGQLSGTHLCDTEFTGESIEEITKQGMAHLDEADDVHHNMLKMIRKGVTEEDRAKWKAKFQKLWDEAPEL